MPYSLHPLCPRKVEGRFLHISTSKAARISSTLEGKQNNKREKEKRLKQNRKQKTSSCVY